MKRAFDTLKSGSFKGASEHLRESAKHLNAGEYADSVTNSIHAVVSVARVLDPKESKSLDAALNSLEGKGVKFHGAFKEGIKKPYARARTGYTPLSSLAKQGKGGPGRRGLHVWRLCVLRSLSGE